jgi:hypothetical protein
VRKLNRRETRLACAIVAGLGAVVFLVWALAWSGTPGEVVLAVFWALLALWYLGGLSTRNTEPIGGPVRYALALCISIALTGVVLSVARLPATPRPAASFPVTVATHGDTTYPITVKGSKRKRLNRLGPR